MTDLCTSPFAEALRAQRASRPHRATPEDIRGFQQRSLVDADFSALERRVLAWMAAPDLPLRLEDHRARCCPESKGDQLLLEESTHEHD
jgi:hypothetical protein